MPLSIIVARDLWYSYPNSEIPALKGVNIAIDKGEFIETEKGQSLLMALPKSLLEQTRVYN